MGDQREHRKVRLVIPDRSGGSLAVDGSGQLPSFVVELVDGETTMLGVCRVILPELGLGGPIVDCFLDQEVAGDGEAAGPIPVLIELPPPPSGWPVPDGWRWLPLADAAPTIEPGLSAYLDHVLDERRGRAIPEPRSLWSRPGWYERACEWIERSLGDADRQAPTSILQVRHWGISAVMRVETPDGRCWFKAVFPHFRHEAAMTAFLDREFPGSVAPVIAVDTDAGWILLDDVGSDSAAGNPNDHRPAVEHLVAMQRAFVGRTDELVAAGCARRSLATLPSEFAAVVASPTVLPWLDVTPERADRLVAWLGDAIAAIESLGIPDTLVHGDFHPGNIAISNGQPILLDWSDAAVSFPLIDVVTWAGWLDDDADSVDALWTTFLESWAHLAPVASLEAIRPTIEGVAGAYHTISYAGILAGLEKLRRPEHGGGLTQFFALLDAAVPTETDPLSAPEQPPTPP